MPPTTPPITAPEEELLAGAAVGFNVVLVATDVLVLGGARVTKV